MRVVLRIVAVFVAICVILTIFQILQFSFSGGLQALAHSGALGAATIGNWLAILIAGPFASVQLWRLRRMGLYLAALLSGLAFTYYVVGLLSVRAPNAPLRPILAAIIFNGLLTVLLLSPSARRSCA